MEGCSLADMERREEGREGGREREDGCSGEGDWPQGLREEHKSINEEADRLSAGAYPDALVAMQVREEGRMAGRLRSSSCGG